MCAPRVSFSPRVFLSRGRQVAGFDQKIEYGPEAGSAVTFFGLVPHWSLPTAESLGTVVKVALFFKVLHLAALSGVRKALLGRRKNPHPHHPQPIPAPRPPLLQSRRAVSCSSLPHTMYPSPCGGAFTALPLARSLGTFNCRSRWIASLH